MSSFWKRWIEANEVERIELVKSLTKIILKYMKEIDEAIKDEDLKIHALSELLNSYFQDLYEEVIKASRK